MHWFKKGSGKLGGTWQLQYGRSNIKAQEWRKVKIVYHMSLASSSA